MLLQVREWVAVCGVPLWSMSAGGETPYNFTASVFVWVQFCGCWCCCDAVLPSLATFAQQWLVSFAYLCCCWCLCWWWGRCLLWRCLWWYYWNLVHGTASPLQSQLWEIIVRMHYIASHHTALSAKQTAVAVNTVVHFMLPFSSVWGCISAFISSSAFDSRTNGKWA